MASEADEARADCQYASASTAYAQRPKCLGDNAQKVCTFMPMSVGHNADGHRDYHKKYKKPIRDEARADCQYGSAIWPMPSAHNAAEPWR